MKKIDPRVLKNQKKYNEAFDRWKSENFPIGSNDYNIIFNCILEAAKNKVLSKVKFFDDEALGKATDLTILIMQRDEIQKHKKIESLGAFLDLPLLQFTINKQLQFNDKLESYENNLENGYDVGVSDEPEEKLYLILEKERYTVLPADWLKDPTKAWEFLFRVEK